jgi:hypothetical protein
VFENPFSDRLRPKASSSAAVASPVLIRKFECFSDIWAPPKTHAAQTGIVDHLPRLQIMRVIAWPVDENPAGLRKVLPALRSFVGWVASRLASCASIRAASSAGSPAAARNVTSVMTVSGARSVWR